MGTRLCTSEKKSCGVVAGCGDTLRLMSDTPWPHFSSAELSCRHCGLMLMQPDFMQRLERVRSRVGFVLPVSSGYRCPEHNARVSTTGRSGPHTTGRAVDIRISGERVVFLVHAALSLGMTGIGVMQRGAHERSFIHLDDLTDGRPRIWSY